MPKGRVHVPSTGNDGDWFQHRGLPASVYKLPYRDSHTSTGIMLSTITKPEKTRYPPKPPQKYQNNDTKNFKNANNFSIHDNRHSFQDNGIYFGNHATASAGCETRLLGKRLMPGVLRHHFTDRTFLKHHIHGEDVNKTSNGGAASVYTADFRNKTAPPAIRRRFPRLYAEGESGPATMTTTTTKCFGASDQSFKTPLQVLASSQEPFQKHNSWKYSFHGKPKCYPPYDKIDSNTPFPVWMLPGVGKCENTAA